MGPGDWFGEIGLIHRRPRTATVTVASPAELWRVPGGEFLDCLADAAAPPAAMLDSMAQRMARGGYNR
ncbi:MAG: cyclic nucleotide-binding domain-containing protein, partial [Actinomycetota bacterium]